MLEQVLTYLNNWFVSDILSGTFTIEDGKLDLPLKEGQYFRIIGSIFNDGLYQYGDQMELTDETFDGAIWSLAVPKTILTITKDIQDWQDKYGETVASPYTSESFGGYSYSKGSSNSNNAETTWQSKFASVLAPYKKLKEMAPVAGGNSHQDPSYKKPFNPEYPWR